MAQTLILLIYNEDRIICYLVSWIQMSINEVSIEMADNMQWMINRSSGWSRQFKSLKIFWVEYCHLKTDEDIQTITQSQKHSKTKRGEFKKLKCTQNVYMRMQIKNEQSKPGFFQRGEYNATKITTRNTGQHVKAQTSHNAIERTSTSGPLP